MRGELERPPDLEQSRLTSGRPKKLQPNRQPVRLAVDQPEGARPADELVPEGERARHPAPPEGGVHRLGGSAHAILVDVHGEATSEKMAMGHYCDGRVSAGGIEEARCGAMLKDFFAGVRGNTVGKPGNKRAEE